MYSPEVTKALNQSNRQFKKIFGGRGQHFSKYLLFSVLQTFSVIGLADALVVFHWKINSFGHTPILA
jgi:hypothetical protein